MTGLWGGRFAYVSPNDSFSLYFKQTGSEVQAWGMVRRLQPPGIYGSVFGGRGTLTDGRLEILMSLSPHISLTGQLVGGRMDATFDYGGKYPVALRRFRPAASEFAGTWVLTSPAGQLDTIIASADGRAYRRRLGYLGGLTGFASQAMWTSRGEWFLIDHAAGVVDSLRAQSGEMVRVMIDGTVTDHYTRVSTSANLP